MDRNYYTDDFERLLREKSDEFRMYPSKRIWHSIYNNIHPGRKWPSVAMTITLITALLLMGYLNTKNTNPDTVSSKNIFQQKTAALSTYSGPVSRADMGKSGNPGENSTALSRDNTTVASNVALTKRNVNVALNSNASPDLESNAAGRSNALTAMGLVHLPAMVAINNEVLKNDPSVAPVTKATISQIINPFPFIKENSVPGNSIAAPAETAILAGNTAIAGGILLTVDQSIAFPYLQKTSMNPASQNIALEELSGKSGKTGIKNGLARKKLCRK